MPGKIRIGKQDDVIPAILEEVSALFAKAAMECRPAVFAHILAHGGTRKDAEDLIHDAVLVVYGKAQKGTLALTGAPGAYLLGVCKNEWLHRLRTKRRDQKVTNLMPVEYTSDDPKEQEWQLAARYRLYREKLDNLGEPCRQLIELDCQKVPLKEIAQLLDYTYDYVRQKKLDCIANLTRLIKQDKRFNDLI